MTPDASMYNGNETERKRGPKMRWSFQRWRRGRNIKKIKTTKIFERGRKQIISSYACADDGTISG